MIYCQIKDDKVVTVYANSQDPSDRSPRYEPRSSGSGLVLAPRLG